MLYMRTNVALIIFLLCTVFGNMVNKPLPSNADNTHGSQSDFNYDVIGSFLKKMGRDKVRPDDAGCNKTKFKKFRSSLGVGFGIDAPVWGYGMYKRMTDSKDHEVDDLIKLLNYGLFGLRIASFSDTGQMKFCIVPPLYLELNSKNTIYINKTLGFEISMNTGYTHAILSFDTYGKVSNLEHDNINRTINHIVDIMNANDAKSTINTFYGEFCSFKKEYDKLFCVGVDETGYAGKVATKVLKSGVFPLISNYLDQLDTTITKQKIYNAFTMFRNFLGSQDSEKHKGIEDGVIDSRIDVFSTVKDVIFSWFKESRFKMDISYRRLSYNIETGVRLNINGNSYYTGESSRLHFVSIGGGVVYTKSIFQVKYDFSGPNKYANKKSNDYFKKLLGMTGIDKSINKVFNFTQWNPTAYFLYGQDYNKYSWSVMIRTIFSSIDREFNRDVDASYNFDAILTFNLSKYIW